MLRLVALATLSWWSASAANEPARTVTFGRDYGPQQALPAFDKGYLLFTNEPSGLEVWGPDGRLAFQTVLTNPPGAHVMSAAVDSDGMFAVGVAYPVAPHGYGGGIAVLDRSGKELRFVETDRYMPAHVCFDAKHTLWTFGWQRDVVRNETDDSQDYFLFRKYSVDGKQLGAYALRSLFPKPGLEPGGASGGLWRLRASNDRIGAIAYSGQTSGNPEWIELGLDGSLIGHWKLGEEHINGMAFTSKNGICGLFDGGKRIDCFDRGTQTWKILGTPAIDDNGRPLGILLGADDEYLVFGKEYGGLRLSWVRAPGQ
jgi:hypothetical protein